MSIARILVYATLAALAVGTPVGAAAQEPSPAFGRIPVSPPWPSKAEVDARRRAQADAVKRFPKLVRQARKLDDAADRARVLEMLADAAWESDKALARRLYVEAFDAAQSLRTEPSMDPARRPLRGHVRLAIVQQTSWRDPGLARDMLDRSAAEPGEGFGTDNDYWPFIDARGHALILAASSLVPTDTEEAARLGRESLRYGVDFSFGELLEKMSDAAPRRARELFFAATATIASPDSPCPANDPLGRYIFGEFAQAGRSSRALPEKAASAADVKVELAGPYLEAIRQRAAEYLDRPGKGRPEADQAESVFCELTELLPAFERYDAEHVDEVRALIEHSGAQLDPLSRKHMYVFYDNGDTWQSLEAEADQCAKPASRRELFSLAASLAISAHSFDEAMRLALRIDDAERRDAAVEGVRYSRVNDALDHGSVGDAVSLARQIPVREHRMRMLSSICTHSAQNGRGREVVPILEELEAYLLECGKDVSPDRAYLHLRLVSVWARVDRARAFDVAEHAALSVSTCVRTPQVATDRQVIWGDATVYDPISNFGWQLIPDALASADYFRALRIALAYDDAALSIAAQIKVVRTALPQAGAVSAANAGITGPYAAQ